jgi:DNA invertase Pin-like site-specific DNA recombinase
MKAVGEAKTLRAAKKAVSSVLSDRRRKVTPQLAATVRKLHKKGGTVRGIGEWLAAERRVSLSPPTIRKILREG